MKKRLSIVVEGRVQGVGFRYFTQEIAVNAGISGWARNRYDGAVEIEAQGDAEQLDAFVENVKEGPPVSNVIRCTVNEIAVLEDDSEFNIKY